jgi:rSAM/selenodomain-associated transferase 1
VADLLLVFLKWPRPGAAKTRLLPALSPEAAADLYRVLAEAEVRGTSPPNGEYERLLCFSPAEERTSIAGWFPGEPLWPQPSADLGGRMSAAFDEGFRRSARRVAIIGTDVPWVTRDHVREAFAALDTNDLCLGPARDGGYYLLALSRPEPRLFEGIAWSTPAVLAETEARARELGLRSARLETLTDVDTLDDVRCEWARLRPLLTGRPELLLALEAAARKGHG